MKDLLKINIFKWVFQKKRILKELNSLKKHNRELSRSKVVLSQREGVMILDAICCDEYKAKVQAPDTRAFVRQIYRGLLAKFRAFIKLDYLK